MSEEVHELMWRREVPHDTATVGLSSDRLWATTCTSCLCTLPPPPPIPLPHRSQRGALRHVAKGDNHTHPLAVVHFEGYRRRRRSPPGCPHNDEARSQTNPPPPPGPRVPPAFPPPGSHAELLKPIDAARQESGDGPVISRQAARRGPPSTYSPRDESFLILGLRSRLREIVCHRTDVCRK